MIKKRRRHRHSRWRPTPGLALLRLSEGDGEAAVNGIQRALAEADDRLSRPGLLAAQIEVTLAVDDLTTAGAACGVLAELARMVGSPMLTATSDRAAGAVQLAAGDGRAALAPLRRASFVFRDLEAAYDVARTGILIATARRALDDGEGAQIWSSRPHVARWKLLAPRLSPRL